MTSLFVAACYVVAGVVNLLPVIGVFSNTQLTSLYGVEVASDDLSLLLRHRAVLFLIVGLLLLTSVAFQSLRLVSGIAGLVSMMSFVLLAWSLPEVNSSLQRIVMIDIIVSVFLFIALVLDQRVL